MGGYMFNYACCSSNYMDSVSSSTLKSLTLLATLAPPSLAEEMEKAALLDFDLTLPIIVAEFLLLMVALDKIYYTPLGNFMDQRDTTIKEKLNGFNFTTISCCRLGRCVGWILCISK